MEVVQPPKQLSKPMDDAKNVMNGVSKPLNDAIRENPEKYLQLQILVCGQTGIGKSSLVNSILGRELCGVGGPGSDRVEGEEFAPETTHVTSVEGNLNGIIVTVWDSPGLQDGRDKDDVYLQEINEKCSNVDLVLYCMDMSNTRWSKSEDIALKLMSEKFSSHFWSKCLLVLTKANMVHVPASARNDKRGYHERVFRTFSQTFKERLKDNCKSITKDIVDEIPIVAAGLVEGNDDEEDECTKDEIKEERELHYISDTEEQAESSPFLPVLIKKCLGRLNDEGRQKFLDATRHDVSEEVSEKAITTSDLDDKANEKVKNFYEKHENALNPPVIMAAIRSHQEIRVAMKGSTSSSGIAKLIRDLRLQKQSNNT